MPMGGIRPRLGDEHMSPPCEIVFICFGEEAEVASLTPGTCGKWLWLLPSGPDQVHHPAMRGGPPARMVARDVRSAAAAPEEKRGACRVPTGDRENPLRPPLGRHRGTSAHGRRRG